MHLAADQLDGGQQAKVAVQLFGHQVRANFHRLFVLADDSSLLHRPVLFVAIPTCEIAAVEELGRDRFAFLWSDERRFIVGNADRLKGSEPQADNEHEKRQALHKSRPCWSGYIKRTSTIVTVQFARSKISTNGRAAMVSG